MSRLGTAQLGVAQLAIAEAALRLSVRLPTQKLRYNPAMVKKRVGRKAARSGFQPRARERTDESPGGPFQPRSRERTDETDSTGASADRESRIEDTLGSENPSR